MGDVNLHSPSWGSHESSGGHLFSDVIEQTSFQILLEDNPVPSLTSRAHQTHSRPDLIMAYLTSTYDFTIYIGDNLGSDHHLMCAEITFPFHSH